MRIAIPLSEGRLSQHFGHSEQFLFVDADLEQRKILNRKVETPPEHAPGVLPTWLAEQGVNVAVSYTHLDVYKRQEHVHRRGILCGAQTGNQHAALG